jgi:hypothetical protein
MTFTAEDRSFITRALVLTGLGIIVVLGGLMLVRTGRPPAERPLVSGDTPVVLVGGTLAFKADSSYPWTLVSGTYQATPNYAIKAIVVKQDLTDGDSGADKLKVDISNAASWEVDEYISGAVGAPDVEVASITGVASTPSTPSPIYLKLSTGGGYLCPGTTPITLIAYSIAPCPPPPAPPPPPPVPDGITFSKVSITVNGQPQPTATLACYDTSDPKGKCRIVFRGH